MFDNLENSGGRNEIESSLVMFFWFNQHKSFSMIWIMVFFITFKILNVKKYKIFKVYITIFEIDFYLRKHPFSNRDNKK